MIVLIDAYNVLHFLYSRAEINKGEIDIFVQAVQKRAKYKGYTVFIVFDGGNSSRASYKKQSAVTLVDSGYGHTADDELRTLMHRYKGFECILISADRALRHAARGEGVEHISPAEYVNLLFIPLDDPAGKEDHISPSFPDELPDDSFEELMQAVLKGPLLPKLEAEELPRIRKSFFEPLKNKRKNKMKEKL